MKMMSTKSVPPTRTACFRGLFRKEAAVKAETTRTRVPAISRTTPSIGETPAASFVEPRLVAEPRDPRASLRVSPASNAPATWKSTYGTNRSPLEIRLVCSRP